MNNLGDKICPPAAPSIPLIMNNVYLPWHGPGMASSDLFFIEAWTTDFKTTDGSIDTETTRFDSYELTASWLVLGVIGKIFYNCEKCYRLSEQTTVVFPFGAGTRFMTPCVMSSLNDLLRVRGVRLTHLRRRPTTQEKTHSLYVLTLIYSPYEHYYWHTCKTFTAEFLGILIFAIY